MSGVEKFSRNVTDEWFTPSRFILITSLCLFIAFPDVITTVATFVFRDYGIFSYPNAYYLRQSFWKGEIPLWNPLSSCGLPFLAQWNTQVLYPPSLFYLILPLEWSLTLFNILHQLFGGIGEYLLLFMLSKSRLGAAIGALIYTFNGLTMNCIMWQSTIAALGWAPWFTMAVYLSLKKSKPVWYAVVAGSMQILSGSPEITLATCVVMLTIVLPLVFKSKVNNRETSIKQSIVKSPAEYEHSVWKMFSRLIIIGGAIAIVTSVQMIPFFGLLFESDRSGSFVGAIWSMPVYGWANLIVPLFHCYDSALGVFLQYNQYWTSSYYCGLIGVLFFVFALLRSDKKHVFLLAIVFLSGIALAMGKEGLLYTPLVKCVPILKMMRYPVKFTLFSMMTIPFFTAESVRILIKRDEIICNRLTPGIISHPESYFEFKQLVWILSVAAISTVLILFDNFLYPLERDNLKAIIVNALERWGLTLGIIACIYALLNNYKPRWFYQFAIPILLFVDLLTHNPIQNPTIQPWVYEPNLTRMEWEKDESLKPLPENGASRVLLRPKDDYIFGRAYMKDLVSDYLASRLFLFCNCNLLDNIPKADGFFPIYLKRHNEFYALLRYSNVTNTEKILDVMSVSHINAPGKFFHFLRRTSYHPFVVSGKEPVFENINNILRKIGYGDCDLERQVIISDEYKNVISAKPTGTWKLTGYRFSPHRISFNISVDTPALVYISQAYSRKWRAFVNGKETKIFPANYAFQCLQIPAGEHHVVVLYVDKGFIIGLILSSFFLLYIGAFALKYRYKTG